MLKTTHVKKAVEKNVEKNAEIIDDYQRCEKCMTIAVNIMLLAKPVIVIFFRTLLTN